MIALIWLLACTLKEVPTHLRPDPPSEGPASAPPATLVDAAAILVGSDPLVRRAPAGEPGFWGEVPGGEPIVAWADLARRPNSDPTDWVALESQWPGSIAVPLARGARLAAMEVLLAGGADPAVDVRATTWLGPVMVSNVTPTSDARAWQVVALKTALDTFELAHDRPSFAAGLADLADALIGNTGQPVDLALLRQRSSSPSAFLAISRAAGGPEASDYDGALAAVQGALVRACAEATSTDLSNEQRAQIGRIADRARR